jgi:3-mercaptopyruvate sulfurtransferase SseA
LLNLGVKNVATLQGGYQAWVSGGGNVIVGNEPGPLPLSRPAFPSKPAPPAKPKAPAPRP